MASVMQYLYHLAVALDQLANALLMGAADETLSARAWRTELTGKVFGRIFRPLIDALAWLITLGHDRGHCRTAYESEVSRKQLHRSYQST
jgi:hypothetical protein